MAASSRARSRADNTANLSRVPLQCLSSLQARPAPMATDTARFLLSIARAGRSAFSATTRVFPTRAGKASIERKHCSFSTAAAIEFLALDRHGRVVRDTGPIPQLNPGGGTFEPDGRYYIGLRSARTIVALSATLDGAGERVLPQGSCRFLAGSHSAPTAHSSSPLASIPMAKATTPSLRLPAVAAGF